MWQGDVSIELQIILDAEKQRRLVGVILGRVY